MRQRHWSVDRILKSVMLIAGVVLSGALVEKNISVWSPGHETEERLARGLAFWVRHSYPLGDETVCKELTGDKETGKSSSESWQEHLGKELAAWLGKQSPFVCFFQMQGQETVQEMDQDPAYLDYLEGQRVMKESAYLLLFGDENTQMEPEEVAEVEKSEEIWEAEAGNMTVTDMAKLTPAYHVREQPLIGTQYVMEQLMDYDFLMQHFYNVHSSTTASREEMNAKSMLEMDFSLDKNQKGPQILIYHTHSQETYADYGPDKTEATVVGVGNYLTQLLEQKGYSVIHDTGQYDIMNGELDRNHAYNYALESITAIPQNNPSIQVVLDVHRDGVKESLHMVSQVNNKATAPIMFFNGMSQTPEGPIEYLSNPYKKENLAFSLQMQLDAAAYFPGLTRKIYLKGLRYNLHLRPRSALIEVGAQTNTYEEARNAMEPLAEILDMVLSGQ